MMLHKPQTKAPDAIDVHVGSRICMQRRLKGMSQTTLAEGLGVTFQQGQNRLQAIANVLDVPVAFFFAEGSGVLPDAQGPDTRASEEIAELLSSAEGLVLNRAFVKIRDARTRSKFVALVKTLAEEASE